MLTGRVVPGDAGEAAGIAAPARKHRRFRVPSRGTLAARLALGVTPSALAVAILACVDHFVAPVSAVAAPLLVAVVIGAFLAGTRAGIAAVLPGSGYLAVHASSSLWPLRYSTDGAEQVLTFIPCALAAALIVGLLQHRVLERVVREREHGERMASLERVKSQFLNVASHELRGPLGVVSGYASMVQDGSFGTLDSVDMRRVAPVLLQKVGEMNTLVNEMLDTARLEESRLTLSLSTVDIGEVMQRAVDAVTPLATERHEILYTPPREPVRVIADPVRIGIVVTNLLQNAVKYSPEGGVVQCFVSVDDDEEQAVVSVWDHGLGIAEADLPRLFSRFGRLVTRENSNIPGTGLGLYLARELARLHGGDITVRSAAGSGSAFTLVLPLQGPPPRKEGQAAQ
ncbi:MAG TPA: HAMP domain-containing sensor histidine kinase [Candidatus Dormibacteraeota bacterium]|nr:HAMP domain-containing sensor histidine kinase [Candidatus Dormibacteraeota bacterium]